MAAVLPLRPNTDSSGTTGTHSSNSSSTRRPSLASFPSNVRAASHSTLNDSTNLTIGGHLHHASNPSSAHSHQSSVHQRLPASPYRRPLRNAKPVKSQYPAESSEKHVEYILVASFDIDRGSVMEYQYPGPVGGDEHMLAELMLPDQAHVRSQDWTIFFLHKDATIEEENRLARKRKKKQKHTSDQALAETKSEAVANQNGFDFGLDNVDEADDDEDEEEIEEEADIDDEDDDDEELEGLDGPPLVYVLNLVNTKQDNTVKRGAIVKAMAICTRHSFLHIYKPLLLLALEQYFANPVVETLAGLYQAVNSMDLSLMPKLNFLEKALLQTSDAKDLFLEKFETMLERRMQEQNQQDAGFPSLDPTISSQVQTRSRYGLPRDTHEFESVVRYANVPVPVKIPTAVSTETVGDFSLIKLITTFSTPHATSVIPFAPTHPHLTTSGPATHPIIVLLNALLTQKRVIFLGHNLPSSEVAEAVLAACALASGGLLRGFTRHAFPYTDLTKIDDLLKVPGFIAGVTNPAFGHKTEWWDLLCDLSTGRMRISNRIEQSTVTEGVNYFQQNPHVAASSGGSQGGISALVTAGASLSAGLSGNNNNLPGGLSSDATGDGTFMQSVLSAIQERHGENAIRSKFRKWVFKFTRLAASFEETVYGASALHVHNPESPKLPFTAESPGVESPGAGGGASINDLPPEVTGHGYVWPSPQAKNNELAANAARIEGWRNTRSYYNLIQDLAILYIHRPVKAVDVQHLHDMLAKLRLGPDPAAHIYLAICAAINTEQEICYLLTVIANGVWESNGSGSGGGGGSGSSSSGGNRATTMTTGTGTSHGLLHIGMGLFHPRLDVREAVAELLGRIRENEAGRHFWELVGRFVKIAFERVMTTRVERGLQDVGEA